MELISLCPFEVGTFVWQPDAGQWSLSLCVKVTFSLEHASAPYIADVQEAISPPQFWDDSSHASLYQPGDFAPLKPQVDVLLIGHAYAPSGIATESLVTRLRIGHFTKWVRVVGDRSWIRGSHGLAPGPPKPFVKMPLRYERAAKTLDNPVGLDLEQLPVLGELALPNLDGAQKAASAGFGPIAPHWRARQQLVDEASEQWARPLLEQGISNAPVPSNFDFGFFNAAPRDQQLDALHPGDSIVLEHVHPDVPRFQTEVPTIRPQAFRIRVNSARPSEIPLRCDTLLIDMDRCILVTTWRGTVDIHAADPTAQIIVAAQMSGKPIRASQVMSMMQEASPFLRKWIVAVDVEKSDVNEPANVTSEMVRPQSEASVLPFQPAARVEVDQEAPTIEHRRLSKQAVETANAAPSSARSRRRFTGTVPIDPNQEAKPALPFTQGEKTGKPRRKFAATVAVDPDAALKPALPFAAPSPAAGAAKTKRRRFATTEAIDPTSTTKPALPFRPPSQQTPPSSQPEAAQAKPKRRRASGTISVDPYVASKGSALPFGEQPSGAKPRGITPLPPSPVVVAAESVAVESKPLSTATNPRPSRVARKKLLPIERYAKIKAELWQGKLPRHAILEKHELTEAQWLEQERYQADAIAEEAKQGKSGRVAALDQQVEAYLSNPQEPTDKEFSLDEYAEIRVAVEATDEISRVLNKRQLTAAMWRKMDQAMRRKALADSKVRDALRVKLIEARKKEVR